MDQLIIPKDYQSALDLHDTQYAIKTVKDFFQNLLAQRLNLTRVSAPLFVDPKSGLNDNLNGFERPVTFDIKEQNGKEAEVVADEDTQIALLEDIEDSFEVSDETEKVDKSAYDELEIKYNDLKAKYKERFLKAEEVKEEVKEEEKEDGEELKEEEVIDVKEI